MSFVFGISQTTPESTTYYDVNISIRDGQTWYDDYGVVTKIAQSGPAADAAKAWSSTVYPVPVMGSATSLPSSRSKQYFFGGVSFGSRTPAGVYKFYVDVTGSYSAGTAQEHAETWSYVYASRDRVSEYTDWQAKTAHPVFYGTDTVMLVGDPWNADATGSTEKVAQVISSSDQVLGGISRTERPGTR
jgi:hypothetical protein